jgi:hypothetical protein
MCAPALTTNSVAQVIRIMHYQRVYNLDAFINIITVIKSVLEVDGKDNRHCRNKKYACMERLSSKRKAARTRHRWWWILKSLGELGSKGLGCVQMV